MEDQTPPVDASTAGNMESKTRLQGNSLDKLFPRNELAKKVMMKSPSSAGFYGDPRVSLEDLHLTVRFWSPGRNIGEKYFW